jgi:hypothetical protein
VNFFKDPAAFDPLRFSPTPPDPTDGKEGKCIYRSERETPDITTEDAEILKLFTTEPPANAVSRTRHSLTE